MADIHDTTSASSLDYLLKKDHIIPTYTAEQLEKSPDDVYRSYSVHAKTHIALGDTQQYVNTIIKWLSGKNAGAFIGGVVGDYGEGKTSFMVHVWEQCQTQNILAVPPFSWRSQSDIVNGVHAWLMYTLRDLHPDAAARAHDVWERYREKSLKETTIKLAQEKGLAYEEVYSILQSGALRFDIGVSSEDLLNYCADVADLLSSTSYLGLLVQLDEPEVAAKGRDMSTHEVGQILFDFANGLLNRQGNYGLFISIPKNFLAQVQTNFQSLPARLGARKCFPSLANFYHDNFAAELWERYANTLHFQDIKHAIISPEALKAIGQVTSSKRRDLSSGPRTVISVFRRAVEYYHATQRSYTPEQFVTDCLDQEVNVNNNYQRLISDTLSSHSAKRVDKKLLEILCAFPEGIAEADLEVLGFDAQAIRNKIGKANDLLYRRAGYVGLTALRASDEQGQEDLLREAIQEALYSYAPRPKTFEAALKAFADYVVPVLFREAKGQDLVGWKHAKLESITTASTPAYRLALTGAFEISQDYPKRQVHLLLSNDATLAEGLATQYSFEDAPDVLISFCLHWQTDIDPPAQRVLLDLGDPETYQPALLQLVLVLPEEALAISGLTEHVDADLLTAMSVLYVLERIGKLSLPEGDAAIWQTIRSRIPAKLIALLFGDEALRTELQAIEGMRIPGAPDALLATLYRHILRQRFPDYQTLMVQARWVEKMKSYASAVANETIPLAARRSLEPWITTKQEAARAFNTSVMNFDDYVRNLHSLVTVKQAKDNKLALHFQLHPFEKAIQEAIYAQSSEKRIKLDGVEVWSIPQEDIVPLMLRSGYQLEELQEIVQIGLQRGSFEQGKHRGRSYLYVKPFAPEQLQAQLRDKLAELTKRIALLRQVPGYPDDTDVAGLEQDIASVDDPISSEKVRNTIHRAFEKENSRPDSYASRLAEEMRDLEKALRDHKGILGQRMFISLKAAKPSGTSRWVSDYAQVVGQLQRKRDSIEEELEQLLKDAADARERYVKATSGSFDERVTRLVEGWQRLGDLQANKDKQKTHLEVLQDYANNNEAWPKLLQDSDDIFEKLDKEQGQESTSDIANLRQQLKALWQNIEQHFQRHGIDGLQAHKQFQEQLNDLNKKHMEYRGQRKAQFDAKKTQANQQLEQLSANRVSEAFNPSDVTGCYQRLYTEVAKHIRERLTLEVKALSQELIELRYEYTVLERIPAEKYQPMHAQLEETYKQLYEQLQQPLEGMIESVCAVLSFEGQTEAADAADFFGAMQASVQTATERVAASRKLRVANRDSAPSLSERAQALEQQLSGEQDLKAVVLEQMDNSQEAQHILNSSLEALAELFRKGRVKIKIEPTTLRRN